MWRTKKDVEKHIQDVLKKVKNDNEVRFFFAHRFDALPVSPVTVVGGTLRAIV